MPQDPKELDDETVPEVEGDNEDDAFEEEPDDIYEE
jgi:hypothetical protein